MLEAATLRKACQDWAFATEVCLISSRPYVCLFLTSQMISDAFILTLFRPEIFDEYTRRQYMAKAPGRNPYGDEEEPAKFHDFDIYTKIRVLQQLSTWTLGNASRIREAMPQDEDHLNWRMEPLGWDKEDRTYFVLDDNRLYRRTDEPPPPPTPKMKAKRKTPKKSRTKGTRASKRRKVEETSEDEQTEEADADAGAQDDTVMTNGDHSSPDEEAGFGFTNKTWECLAITLEEYQDFLSTISRTRDPNEKQLRRRIEEDVLPIIEKRAEALRQKQLKKIRELENLQKMATAKRSGRLAEKAEKDKQEREEREVEEKKQRDLQMAHEEQERQRRIEEGHESRRLTREQRLKEREVKRILHEEELARIEEHANRASSQTPASDSAADSKRISERQLKTQKAQHKKELEKLAEDEDKWYFDCSICGMHGENLDDGSHSIACERCNVWQHSTCHGFSPKQAEKDGFHFVCATCKRKEEDAKKPKIAPLKLSKNRQSSSPETHKSASRPSTANAHNTPKGALPDHVKRQLDGVQQYMPPSQQRPGPFGPIMNGPNLSPFGQAPSPSGYRYPPVSNFAPQSHQVPPPQQAWPGSSIPPPPRPSSSGYAGSPPPPMANGYASPHQQHQHQHQNMHQTAIVASGGHPSYQAQYQPEHQPQANGYSPRAPAGMYPMTHPSPPQQHYYQPNNQYYNQQQQPQRPPPGQTNNGMQSPHKNDFRPPSSSSPPQYPPYSHAQLQPKPHFAQTPNANFPPPTQTHPQHGAPSPSKSSPSPAQYYQQPSYQQQPPHLTPTPQAPHQFRPPSSNGLPPNHQTPQHQHQQSQPSPANANANSIVADGMSGPWPNGSKAIPQKHDRSPAPAVPPTHSPLTNAQAPRFAQQHSPTLSSQGTQTMRNANEKNPTPQMAPPVALSPSQQMQEQAQAADPASVPIKKMPLESPLAVQQGTLDGSVDSHVSPAGRKSMQPLAQDLKEVSAPEAAHTSLANMGPAPNSTSGPTIEHRQQQPAGLSTETQG